MSIFDYFNLKGLIVFNIVALLVLIFIHTQHILDKKKVKKTTLPLKNHLSPTKQQRAFREVQKLVYRLLCLSLRTYFKTSSEEDTE